MEDFKGELTRLEWLEREILNHEAWLAYFKRLLENERALQEEEINE